MKLLDTESLRNYLLRRKEKLSAEGLTGKVKTRSPQVKIFDANGHLLAVDRTTEQAKELIEAAQKLVKQSRLQQ